MSRTLLLLASLLLATGAGAQTTRPAASGPARPFYAEATVGPLVRLFGTVRLLRDSVEVIVSEGSVGYPWVSLSEPSDPASDVRLRPFFDAKALGEPDPGGPGAVIVLPKLQIGEERPIGRVRFVLPRPAASPDSMGLVFQVISTQQARYPYGADGLTYACGRYGAFVVSRARAEPYMTCVSPAERSAGLPGSIAARDPEARRVPQVCVEDPTTPTGMRPSDVIVQRLPGDSAVGRAGERLPLKAFRPRVVGYATGPRGLEPDRANVNEPWIDGYTTILGRQFARFELRVPPPSIDSLVRIGEVQGASVFLWPGTAGESPPLHVFVLSPDCSVTTYVRPPHD